MRKVIYGVACSLDGFLAGPGGALDWLHFSEDAHDLMSKAWAQTDALLYGRKTWEEAAARGGGPSTSGIKNYVFSRSLRALQSGGAELVRDDAGAFVNELKKQAGGDILLMSGGHFASSLMKAGAIDEIRLNIHPVLLGSGVPTFVDGGKRFNLELMESRILDGGCILVVYRVKF